MGDERLELVYNTLRNSDNWFAWFHGDDLYAVYLPTRWDYTVPERVSRYFDPKHPRYILDHMVGKEQIQDGQALVSEDEQEDARTILAMLKNELGDYDV